MQLSEVMPYFNGNGAALARALGVTRGAVHLWRKSGEIPELQIMKLKYEVLPSLEADARKAKKKQEKRKQESQQA